MIRDFDQDAENFNYIKEIVTKDLIKIWGEIKKPNALKNLKPEEFFRVDFHTLGHYVYKREEFEQDCLALADKLRSKSNPDFLFQKVEVDKNIPMDGLFMYIQQVWGSIRQNKELNLPSQKIMVSNYRCSEVKKEAIENV